MEIVVRCVHPQILSRDTKSVCSIIQYYYCYVNKSASISAGGDNTSVKIMYYRSIFYVGELLLFVFICVSPSWCGAVLEIESYVAFM